jgi:anti-sigma-K factor RskA
VNPQFHDEFVALCALFYSGELSEEDWALLQIHMAYCDSCHDRFLQYQKLTSDVIPAMAGAAAAELDRAPAESASSLEAAERKLMREVDSVSAKQEETPRAQKPNWPLYTALIAACGLGIAFLVSLHFIRTKPQSATGTAQVLPVQEGPNPGTAAPDANVQQALERSQGEVAGLQQRLTAAEDRTKRANLALDSVEKQLQAEQAARKEISQDRETLGRQLTAAQTEMESLRNAAAGADANRAQQAVRMARLETKVRELNADIEEKDTALSEKDRMLAADKDFLAHDRDIRDLIGARNLYIADIFDTTESGRTAKQFGRIFYTKDRSLIFYGFDLERQAGLKRDASFQVWGSGSDRPAVSLGLFYQDDSRKRWVLRCTDPKILARLDMVFVTVEPPGGSTRPTGKQLLRAYLQIPSNHP